MIKNGLVHVNYWYWQILLIPFPSNNLILSNITSLLTWLNQDSMESHKLFIIKLFCFHSATYSPAWKPRLFGSDVCPFYKTCSENLLFFVETCKFVDTASSKAQGRTPITVNICHLQVCVSTFRKKSLICVATFNFNFNYEKGKTNID